MNKWRITEMSYKILIINPGSTSTKIGVFEDETLLFEETLRHTTEELAGFNLGVDEYISKPFSPKILVARVEAILRRTNASRKKVTEDNDKTDIFNRQWF